MRNTQRNLSIVFVLAVSLFIMSLPVHAQGTITVKCVDSAGNPVAGAKIVAQNIAGKAGLKEKKSDGKGNAEFSKSEDGVYRIVGHKEGFAPAFYEFLQLKGDTQQVTLTFKAGDVNSKLYFEDTALSGKAYEAMNAGLNLLRENKFADAETQLKSAIEINPSIPAAHFYLAIACLQQRKWDQGAEAMKNASALAGIMLAVPARDPTAPNPNAEIKQKADEQIAKIPGLKYRSEGEALFTQKKYDEALAKFKEALQTDPADADLYSYIAVASANMQKFDEASQAIEKSIQLKPTEKAFVDTREKIKTMQTNATLAQAQKILQEGDELYKKQDYTGAIKRYETALPMITGPKQAVVYAAIARGQAGLNDSDKTIEAYRKAMELNPEGQDYRNALAQYYLKLKKYEDALNLYTDTKGAGGQSADKALFDLGKKQSDQGNNEVATLAFERAIKANPENAEAYYELGMLLYFDKSNDARASELLTKYVEIGKNTDHVNNTKNVLGVLKRRMAPKK